METLKGKNILIGKEPVNGRLLIVVEGYKQKAAVGAQGSVPSSVSRCRQAEGVAHAKISVDKNGGIVVTNMNPKNVTYINNRSVESLHVTPADSMALGKDKYAVSISTVLDTAEKIVAAQAQAQAQRQWQPQQPEPPKTFNISHLEDVWNDLKAKKKEIQAKQKKTNLIRTGCSAFTLCTVPLAQVVGPGAYALSGIGLIGALYGFFGIKNDKTADVMDQLNEDFQDKYVCPNPDCGKFLGNYSYKLMKKQYGMKCPYCKSNYVEN